MARMARFIVPGLFYHVMQRGNYKQPVFYSTDDRLFYLALLNERCEMYSVRLFAYCLMDNHVHLIASPMNERSFSSAFRDIHMRYAQHINKRNKQIGHLWQGRYRSKELNESHLYAAVRYVETNPVRARITKNPWDYKWSSARYHVGIASREVHLHNLEPYIDNWRDYLMESNEQLQGASIDDFRSAA
jgi:putative transposase